MKSLLRLCIAALLTGLGSLCAAEFFPLHTGYSWTYREARTGQTFTVRVGLPEMHNDVVYHRLHGYVSQPVPVRLQDGNLYYFDEENNRDLLLISFEPFEGGSWNAWLRGGCDTMGQTQVKRGSYDGAIEHISNPIEIRYRVFGCADTGLEAEQFAENIGMLRRTVQTIAGPRTFELVRAQLGPATRIDVERYGRFSVNISSEPQSDTFKATLTLETNSEHTLKLDFPSGQEYDLQLKDQDGNVLYTWSADKLFVAAFHSLEVNGRWTATVEIPKPRSAEPKAAAYFLHAWLVTAGPNPSFAVITPLTLTSGLQ